jgi:hypothetical protein
MAGRGRVSDTEGSDASTGSGMTIWDPPIELFEINTPLPRRSRRTRTPPGWRQLVVDEYLA